MRRIGLVIIVLALMLAILAPRAAPQSRVAEDELTQWLVLVQNESTPTFTPTATPTPTVTPSPTPMPAMVRVDPGGCQFDPPGIDGTRYEEEWVCLRNVGELGIDLQGWEVRDESGVSYLFPFYWLAGDATVTLHTGSGINLGPDLYWGSNRFVWNNGGDTVYLMDASGVQIDRYSY